MYSPPDHPPLISVIVPALNEAKTIGPTLASLAGLAGLELIVVDGGSSDDTGARAEAAGARVIEAPAGRARQMNEGARAARGDILLFLHADTLLPPGFAGEVREALNRPGTAAGAFGLAIEAPGLGFRCLERLVRWRGRWLAMPYGDQALFLTAAMFDRVGRFADLPIMEDFELVGRLRRQGRIVLLPRQVRTSARRWRRLGLVRTTLVNQAIVLGYLGGIDPARLARWYRGR